MADLRFVGKERARPEGLDKAAGRAHYVHDLERPGMLHAKIKWSGQAHARIKRIDTSRAERLPGVAAVVTGYNTPELRIGFLRDNFVLKRDKVRQQRDEVAAVAAVSPEVAQAAVDLIEIEYEPLPAVFTTEAALAPGASLVHEIDPSGKELASNRLTRAYGHRSGDVAAARRASRFVVEGVYTTPRVQQCCLGTAGCIAELDGNQNLTIWTKTQIPFLAQRDFNQALAALGLPGKNTRVIVPWLGGGFGTGLDTHAYEYLAILLAHRTGRPVKVLYSREEEFAYLSPRQESTIRLAQGCDERGRLTFREADVVLDNGAYTSWGATYPTVMMLPATSLYRVPNVRFDASLVYTNNTYCQAMRGYGGPEMTWAIESNLDELAEAASIDPYAMRLLNRNEPGETTPMGIRVTTCGLKECLEATARRLDWTGKRGKGKRRGVGMAALAHVGGSGRIYRSDGSGIILKLDDFGNANVYYGGVEMGQGLHSVLALGVAEALGITPDRVIVNPTDTGTCPWDVGTHASRGAFVALNASLLAAKKARERIFELAETVFPAEVGKALARDPGALAGFDLAAAAKRDRFELRENELTLKDGPVDPRLRLELGKLLRAVHFREGGEVLTFEAFYDPPTQPLDLQKGTGDLSATYAYGAQGAEVEVDEETGEVKILKLVAVHDVGKVLNPQTLAGQLYGALAQGVGYALYEQVLSREGRILNPDFRDYKLPTVAEMAFPIELEFVETQDAAGPFGAKGIGEHGLIPTAPAIANAIHDAVGVRIRDLPITPEKVLAALSARAALTRP